MRLKILARFSFQRVGLLLTPRFQYAFKCIKIGLPVATLCACPVVNYVICVFSVPFVHVLLIYTVPGLSLNRPESREDSRDANLRQNHLKCADSRRKGNDVY